VSTIIDRYVTSQFLRNFGIFFCSFTGLYVVVDTFNNLDEFLTYGERQGNLAAVLLEYYSYRGLWFFDLTGSMLALIAAMFTVAAMQRSNELTALLAAGISKRRIVMPMIVSAGVIAAAAVVNREFFLPQVRHRLSRNAQDWMGEAGVVLKPRYDYKTSIFINGARTFANQQRIEKPAFRLPAELSAYGRVISADAAYWQPASEGEHGETRPGGYRFVGLHAPEAIVKRPSLELAGERIILSPMDTPWLGPQECFIVTEVSFEQLEAGAVWRQFSSTSELIAGLHNESLRYESDVRVNIHARIVQPMLDMSLLFLGLPLVLSRESRNIFLSIGRCGLIVIAFMVTVMACHSLGRSLWIEPVRAAWLPLFIFVPGAAAMSGPLRE
jgi:lipopolysaccharide export system permease protein